MIRHTEFCSMLLGPQSDVNSHCVPHDLVNQFHRCHIVEHVEVPVADSEPTHKQLAARILPGIYV